MAEENETPSESIEEDESVKADESEELSEDEVNVELADAVVNETNSKSDEQVLKLNLDKQKLVYVAMALVFIFVLVGGIYLSMSGNSDMESIAKKSFTLKDDDGDDTFLINGDEESVEVKYICSESSTCDLVAFVQFKVFFDKLDCKKSVDSKFDNLRPIDGTVTTDCGKAEVSFSLSRDTYSEYSDVELLNIVVTADRK